MSMLKFDAMTFLKEFEVWVWRQNSYQINQGNFGGFVKI